MSLWKTVYERHEWLPNGDRRVTTHQKIMPAALLFTMGLCSGLLIGWFTTGWIGF